MKRRGFIGSLIGCIGIPFIQKDEKIPVYTMEIKSTNVVVGPRKLKARRTDDVESDLINMMRIDIQKEIDQEVINKMLASAKKGC